MMTKILRYARALTRWIKNGREVRSETEIAELYDKICSRCKEFNVAQGICEICGCRVNTSRNPLINKLAMSTEKCPKDKWEAESRMTSAGRRSVFERLSSVEVPTVGKPIEDTPCGICGMFPDERIRKTRPDNPFNEVEVR